MPVTGAIDATRWLGRLPLQRGSCLPASCIALAVGLGFRAASPSLVAAAEPVEVLNRTVTFSGVDNSVGVLRRSFRLPDEVRRQDDVWYLLRVRVWARPGGASSGSVTVSSAVNAFTANRIEIAKANACEEAYSWRSLDLLRGSLERVKCGPAITGESTNYLQSSSIRPGQAEFSIRTAGLGESGVVRILPGSGVYRTDRGPARLKFSPVTGDPSMEVGEWTALPFSLVNTGDRPARRVTVKALASPWVGIQRGGARLSKTIGAHETVSGLVWLRPRHEGRFKVILAAASTTNGPGVELVIDGRNGAPGHWARLREFALAVVVVSALVLLVWWTRDRRSGARDE